MKKKLEQLLKEHLKIQTDTSRVHEFLDKVVELFEDEYHSGVGTESKLMDEVVAQVSKAVPYGTFEDEKSPPVDEDQEA